MPFFTTIWYILQYALTAYTNVQTHTIQTTFSLFSKGPLGSCVQTHSFYPPLAVSRGKWDVGESEGRRKEGLQLNQLPDLSLR